MCFIKIVYEESYRSSWQDHASTEELLLRKSRYETYEKRTEAAQMEDDWTYTKTGAKQRLQHSNDLGTRRKKKKSKTKNHLEANGWKGKGRSGMAIVAGSEDRCG